MKRAVRNLTFLSVVSLCLILLLVKNSDPDQRFIVIDRTNAAFTVSPAGSIAFPGKISLVQVSGHYIYGYVHKQGSIYRYDLLRHRLETFIGAADSMAGTTNGLQVAPDAPVVYRFTTSGRQVLLYRLDGSLADSIVCNDHPYVKGVKGLGTGTFIFQWYDTAKVASMLKLVHYGSQPADSVIYTFPHFDDGGISEDGQFICQPATGDVYFIPFYNSRIIRYNQGQNRLYNIVTIDSTPPANVTLHTSSGYFISSKALLLNSAATADSGHLYLLSYARAGNDAQQRVNVDVYAVAGSRYQGTISLPAPPTGAVLSLAKSGDTLFVSSVEKVMMYKLEAR